MLGIPLFLPIIIYNYSKFENSDLDIKSYSTLGLVHSLGHIATCLSLNAGTVSFTHVVKAAEPFFASIFSAIILKQTFPIYVYATLIPIIFGVGLASSEPSSFSMVGFTMAMLSNICYQLRAVLAKLQMPSTSKQTSATQLSPANVFRVLTIYASFIAIPFMLLLEGGVIRSTFKAAVLNGVSMPSLLANICVSSFSFYFYNEVSFWVLGDVHPITHSIGNSLKRIFVIVVSSIVLRTQHSIASVIGCTLAILGTVAYALTSR
jgi:solute carrier family 35 protein E1